MMLGWIDKNGQPLVFNKNAGPVDNLKSLEYPACPIYTEESILCS
jgi:hypothetical protein